MLHKLVRSARPSAESHPEGLLLACHVRIREFTELARRLVNAEGAGADLVAGAAADLHRYHTVALPLHQEDEDETIRPRLEAAGVPGEIGAALEAMTSQHVDIEARVAELVPMWATLRTEPGRIAELASGLRATTERLGALWDVHLPLEEGTVLPAMSRYLDADTLGRILGEMRARRAPATAWTA